MRYKMTRTFIGVAIIINWILAIIGSVMAAVNQVYGLILVFVFAACVAQAMLMVGLAVLEGSDAIQRIVEHDVRLQVSLPISQVTEMSQRAGPAPGQDPASGLRPEERRGYDARRERMNIEAEDLARFKRPN